MINQIVTDPNLVWDSNSVQMGDLYFPLYRKLKTLSVENKHVDQFRTQFLDGNKGIGIIDLKLISDDINVQTRIYKDIVEKLGTCLVQNIAGETVVSVKDAGKSMSSGARYHQSREGGSLHTDGPHFEKRPDYVGLFCVRKAKMGGVGQYLSAYSIHNELLKTDPKALKILYGPFHFDKRGEVVGGESPTIFAPIFESDGKTLSFRYLSEYVKDGHIKVTQPLTKEQDNALDLLDALLKNSTHIVKHNFESGEVLFLNNYRIAHGRSSFTDYSDQNYRRLMLRTWIMGR